LPKPVSLPVAAAPEDDACDAEQAGPDEEDAGRFRRRGTYEVDVDVAVAGVGSGFGEAQGQAGNGKRAAAAASAVAPAARSSSAAAVSAAAAAAALGAAAAAATVATAATTIEAAASTAAAQAVAPVIAAAGRVAKLGPVVSPVAAVAVEPGAASAASRGRSVVVTICAARAAVAVGSPCCGYGAAPAAVLGLAVAAGGSGQARLAALVGIVVRTAAASNQHGRVIGVDDEASATAATVDRPNIAAAPCASLAADGDLEDGAGIEEDVPAEDCAVAAWRVVVGSALRARGDDIVCAGGQDGVVDDPAAEVEGGCVS